VCMLLPELSFGLGLRPSESTGVWRYLARWDLVLTFVSEGSSKRLSEVEKKPDECSELTLTWCFE
jgi:hypothetical protein